MQWGASTVRLFAQAAERPATIIPPPLITF
jgi:hypothetical protein